MTRKMWKVTLLQKAAYSPRWFFSLTGLLWNKQELELPVIVSVTAVGFLFTEYN